MSIGYTVLGFGSGVAGYGSIEATGGTITEVGAYRYHTFTSSGNFVVSAVGEDANTLEYLVVASGGGGHRFGGGGAGGMRNGSASAVSYTHLTLPTKRIV